MAKGAADGDVPIEAMDVVVTGEESGEWICAEAGMEVKA